MTKEEIIELAREALKQEPREDWNSTAWVFADETLQAFAKLVAEKERQWKEFYNTQEEYEQECVRRQQRDGEN